MNLHLYWFAILTCVSTTIVIKTLILLLSLCELANLLISLAFYHFRCILRWLIYAFLRLTNVGHFSRCIHNFNHFNWILTKMFRQTNLWSAFLDHWIRNFESWSFGPKVAYLFIVRILGCLGCWQCRIAYTCVVHQINLNLRIRSLCNCS